MTDHGGKTITTDEIAPSGFDSSILANGSNAKSQLAIDQPSATTSSCISNRLPSHLLLILSDSALPLGSFAFSSGLESYTAHHSARQNAKANTLPEFLHLSLTSLATSTIPYLIAAFKCPEQLAELDETYDATILCPVARRASLTQGKALMTLWERALRTSCARSEASEALDRFLRLVKTSTTLNASAGEAAGPQGHFPLLWSAISAASSIPLPATVYTFLLNHAKAIVSASVRASVVGPYAAQGVLASKWLIDEIEALMVKHWEGQVIDAGQGVPVMEIWVGRHELLYSRIFNS